MIGSTAAESASTNREKETFESTSAAEPTGLSPSPPRLGSTSAGSASTSQEKETFESTSVAEPTGLSPPVSSSSSVSLDPANWVVNDKTIDFLLSKEIDQNINEKNIRETKTFYPTLKKSRSLTEGHFKRKLANGEVQHRSYLVYSCNKKALFCAPCHLFGGTSLFAAEGFTDWRNVGSALQGHENSPEHHRCQIAFLHRSNIVSRIDADVQKQIRAEVNYWRNVLRRVIAVIRKLSSRGMAFRRTDEKFGSKKKWKFYDAFRIDFRIRPIFGNSH